MMIQWDDPLTEMIKSRPHRHKTFEYSELKCLNILTLYINKSENIRKAETILSFPILRLRWTQKFYYAGASGLHFRHAYETSAQGRNNSIFVDQRSTMFFYSPLDDQADLCWTLMTHFIGSSWR
jgi:hypothetical protein